MDSVRWVFYFLFLKAELMISLCWLAETRGGTTDLERQESGFQEAVR